MTLEEQQRLMRLVERIAGQPKAPKDAEAVSALAQLLRKRPDAAYWLLRRCLLLEAAGERALLASAGGAASLAMPAQPVLRDLLGEFTNTSLLGDLAATDEPVPRFDAPGAPQGH